MSIQADPMHFSRTNPFSLSLFSSSPLSRLFVLPPF
jgi:hypothetical protein